MSEEDGIIILFAFVVIALFFITLLAFLDFLNVHKKRPAALNQKAQSDDYRS